ncbi:hypothetical protein HOF78_01200 [Candidatus Woesearchaeota archaeon]|nr:hypothetical protein [Candidatus Woesearchaeota archaeon]MBT6045001.1 hypothetical protein [Candidatus Woesearchaeota archaeon]
MQKKRIPVVIGKDQDPIDIKSANVGWYSPHVTLTELNEDGPYGATPRDIFYEISFPEDGTSTGYRETYKRHGIRPPKGEVDGTERIMQIIARDTEGILKTHEFIPVRWREVESLSQWEFMVPDKDFSERIIEYRKNIPTKIDLNNQTK